MPADYTNVEQYLRKLVQDSKSTESLTSQIAAIFVRQEQLHAKLLAESQFCQLEIGDITSILHVLHALGDILWFDDSGGALADVVFLSPDFVIDFVRKMINHELGEPTVRHGCFTWLGSPKPLTTTEKAVNNEGRVAHKLLTSLALWCDISDDNLMLQLKELMFHFQLAYPAGAKRLQFDSDLIVPVYWKKNTKTQSIPKLPPMMTAIATWDYDFQNGFPPSLFDRLGVTSYSAIYSNERFFSRDAFGTQTDAYWAKIAKHSDVDDNAIGSSTLRIQIAAALSPIAWQQLAWYGISVERVLEEYPGLWVVRYAVSKNGQRYELDHLLEERQAREEMSTMAPGMSSSSTCELLPPSLEWLTKREWRNTGKKKSSDTATSAETRSSSSEPASNAAFEKLVQRMDDMKRQFEGLHSRLDDVQETAITLSAAEGNNRDYPALWTLAYREGTATSTYELQMRSELSGKCYHDPIRITVPNSFFSKYGVVIKTGLSVMCAVVPDMLGKGVVEYLASAAGDQVDRSMAVHSLVEGLNLESGRSLAMENNRTLSPDATVALLRDLLKIVDDAFDPLKMTTISGLECGIRRKTGEHLWAHRREIEARSDTIRFRHDYRSDVVVEHPHRRRTPLHLAASCGNEDVIILLLDRGCPIDVRDEVEFTPLHDAAQLNSEFGVEVLLNRGADLEVRDKFDRTPLHYGAQGGYEGVPRILVDRGARVDAEDEHGVTPLLLACEKGTAEVVRMMLDQKSKNSTSQLLFHADEAGSTPMLHACVNGHVEVARLLLEKSREGKEGENYEGKQPTPATFALLDVLARVIETNRAKSDVLAAVWGGWREQLENGKPLAQVPQEVLDAGPQDVRSFFKSLHHSGASYRKKLCVIGPGSWGKTSLIKTLTTNKATRERADTRTIGIDRFSWSFEVPASGSSPGRLYEVSVLDFAGQEEYQSAHTIFYSKRTLYVVCVNVKVYNDRLTSYKITSSGQPHDAMDAFFDDFIYSRIRAVCAREPESEFAFVGTKLDLVRHSDECVRRVGDDVLARFRRRDADEIRALDRVLGTLKLRGLSNDAASNEAIQAKVARLEDLRRQRPKLLTRTFVAMSSANTKGLADVRQEIQDCIVSGDSAFLMPADYTNVERFIRKIVREAKESESLTAQITEMFVQPDVLHKTIQDDPQFAALEIDDITSILHVLHALGDILWFDKSGGALSDLVFLSPDLVIDFVRKVINHELGERRPGCFMWLGSPRGLTAIEKAVKKEGRVAHKLLTSLALWRDVNDDRLMLQLKELLFHFQLAYPAGAKRLQFDSDLIVPVYWKKNSKAQSIPRPPPALKAVATWDYDFQNGLPASLFDRLGVTSYSAIYSNDRFFSRDSFGTQTDVYWAKVSKHSEEDDDNTVGSSTLRIQVAASTSPTAWQQLVWYAISVERVLEEYPGLWVVRYAVSKDGERYELDQLLEGRQERMTVDSMAGVPVDSSTCELLPASMDWFTKREWQNVGKKRNPDTSSSGATEVSSSEPSLNGYEKLIERMERGIQGLHTHLDEVQDTSITLAAAAGNRRDYPALWTLDYWEKGATSIYELQLRSELSGKCYHDPIRITVPNGLFRNYDVVIKTGLSVMCAVIPDMLGKGVVEYLASGAGEQIDRAVAVHSLVDGLDLKTNQSLTMEKNRTLSPDATVALLRDLLKITDDTFDPLKMSTTSGLECGIYVKAVGQRKKGEHVWAHRREIEAQSDTIRLRHDYHAVSSIKEGSIQSASSTTQAGASGPVLPRLDPSKNELPLSTDASALVLEIVGATNLPDVRLVGTQSPFCQWRIGDPHGDPVASSQTLVHVRGGCNPDWSGQLFRVSTAGKTLRGCVFVAAVITETAIGAITEVIGEGTHRFSDDEVSTGKSCEFNVVLTSKGEPAGSLSFRLQG